MFKGLGGIQRLKKSKFFTNLTVGGTVAVVCVENRLIYRNLGATAMRIVFHRPTPKYREDRHAHKLL